MDEHAPHCKIVWMTPTPVDALLATWWNSRDKEMPGQVYTAKNFRDRIYAEHDAWHNGKRPSFSLKDMAGEKWVDLEYQAHSKDVRAVYDYLDEVMLRLFFDICRSEAPAAEFIQFSISFINASRAFVDQLDRHRHASFWEASMRIKDLSRFADAREYMLPPQYHAIPLSQAVYDEAMHHAQEAYNQLLLLGWPMEMARGVVPLHITTRADMSINLRNLREMIRRRSCALAQGEYWRPFILSFLQEVMHSDMPQDPRTLELFGALPCDPANTCTVYHEAIGRVKDRTGLICPILLSKYAPADLALEGVQTMRELYGLERWKAWSLDYLKALGKDPNPFLQLLYAAGER